MDLIPSSILDLLWNSSLCLTIIQMPPHFFKVSCICGSHLCRDLWWHKHLHTIEKSIASEDKWRWSSSTTCDESGLRNLSYWKELGFFGAHRIVIDFPDCSTWALGSLQSRAVSSRCCIINIHNKSEPAATCYWRRHPRAKLLWAKDHQKREQE